MHVSLPPALTAAIGELLQGVSRSDLAARTARQTDAYRGGGTSTGIKDEADALAYLLARMPATYAAVRAALARLRQAAPDFAPASLADIGAGPGTASWAAADAWPGLAPIAMLDANPAFRAIAARLAKAGLPDVEVVAGDIGAPPGADLVIASYVLAELPQGRAGEIALRLWAAATQALVIIEPGTPQGFARIRAARAGLIAAGAHVAAPCTHDAACPITEGDWCHFSQRLPRSRDHMRAKGASVPFEDERYCYVAVTRTPVVRGAARIIAPPLDAKPCITFKLCDAAGLWLETVARRDKSGFSRARRLGWGDLF